MKTTTRIGVVLALVAGLLAITAAAASATHGRLTGTGSCPTAASTWSAVLTFDALDVPRDVYGEVKAITTSAGTLDVAPGKGVKAGAQVILNAWPSHAQNWPGVLTRKGTWTDRFSVVGIPASVKSIRVMAQYDYTNGHSDDPVVVVPQPSKCEPPFVPDTRTEKRPTEVVDCVADNVITILEERTSTETAPGVWGPWSPWVVIETGQRPTTDAECPAPPVTPPTTPPAPPSCDELCPVPTQTVNGGGLGEDLVCDGLYEGTYRNVYIPKGATCILKDAYVNGSVNGAGGRNAYVLDTTVVRHVRLVGFTGDVVLGNKVGCRYDPRIGGNLTVKNSHNVLACQLTVCGSGKFKGNDGRITVRDSAFGRNLFINGNRRFVSDHGKAAKRPQPIQLRDVSVDGRLDTSGNAPRRVIKKRVSA